MSPLSHLQTIPQTICSAQHRLQPLQQAARCLPVTPFCVSNNLLAFRQLPRPPADRCWKDVPLEMSLDGEPNTECKILLIIWLPLLEKKNQSGSDVSENFCEFSNRVLILRRIALYLYNARRVNLEPAL
ncbi:hypothetical protein V5799_016159 [Amblyomma americanum]|uniref:Uncharacterized protein n=1 Tax=Amblyomma americanum TaxID=6943 RepID=A0AAQ4F5U7_AMBAM